MSSTTLKPKPQPVEGKENIKEQQLKYKLNEGLLTVFNAVVGIRGFQPQQQRYVMSLVLRNRSVMSKPL